MKSFKNRSALLEVCFQLSRSTKWDLVGRIALPFSTHHPQGLAFAGENIFLSSVEILEAPTNVFDPDTSTPGSGLGHLFVLNEDGSLLHDIVIGEGDMYHPGGIDFDGSQIWVPVGEYRPGAKSIMFTIDPKTFEVSERFRALDSIGWAVSDTESGAIYGGNWGSRRFYTWNAQGEELGRWENPSSFIDYQDCMIVQKGFVICSGIANLSQPHGKADYELGGIAVIDFINHSLVHETPLQIFSSAGHVITRNPFSLTLDSDGLFLHVAPDDGQEVNGTELLTFKARI